MQKQIIALFTVGYLCLFTVYANAQKPLDKVQLAWDMPTQTVDGSPIVGDLYARLYMCDAPIRDDKTCDGDMQIFSLPAPGATTSGVQYMPKSQVGNLYIRAAAHYNDTRESVLSNMVTVPFDVRTAPMPIVNLRAQ